MKKTNPRPQPRPLTIPHTQLVEVIGGVISNKPDPDGTPLPA